MKIFLKISVSLCFLYNVSRLINLQKDNFLINIALLFDMPKKSTYNSGNVWIVIAAYNEEKNLAKVVASIFKEGFSNIAVVDDGSADSTYKVALGTGAWVLHHKINLGQGAALQTGISFALEHGAEAVVTFDADGQHMANEIKNFISALNKGYDVVLGSRFLQKNEIPFMRRLVLKGGIFFTRVISGIAVTDTHNGFRIFSKDAARKVTIEFNDMTHASEILDKISKYHLKYKEIPVTIKYSKETLRNGQSSLNAIKIALKMLFKKLIFG